MVRMLYLFTTLLSASLWPFWEDEISSAPIKMLRRDRHCISRFLQNRSASYEPEGSADSPSWNLLELWFQLI